MLQFAFTGINHSHNFYQLEKEVITEIDENIKSFINPYQFEKYFIYLNNAFNAFYEVIEIHKEDLNKVNIKEYTEDEIKALEPIKKADYLLFMIFSLEINSCLDSYVDVKSYINKQEILYGNKKEIINIGIPEISKSDFEKIQLTERANINEITTYFENLNDSGKINTSVENIKRVLISVFEDNKGIPLKKSTLDTYFNKSKKENRSKK